MITLVVDCMGSDNGSQVTVGGILDFLKENKDTKIIAVGKKEELQLLEGVNNVEILDARDVVPMDVGAIEVMRMRESSLVKAIDLMKKEGFDGVVSAGSTGGFLTAATIKLKTIEGVERAALVSPFPSEDGGQVTVLDIGANNENTASQIVQFAKMGRIYAKGVLNVENPKTYLLSNGAEEKKGTPEVKEAHQILKNMKFEGFMGNIEGRDALSGGVDVLVTGGYAGNVFLKSTEGMASIMNRLIKKSFKRNLLTKIGYLFAKKGFDEMKKTMNYKRFGGAMLLGVNGVVVKAHGSSDVYSFKCAIQVAYNMAKIKVVDMIAEGVKELD